MSLDDFGKLFGPAPQRLIADSQLKMVGFESINQITNRGPAMKKATGLTSIWSMGQFPPGDQTVIIVPYRPSTDATFGAIVKDDYFGQVPADRLKQVAGAALFLADGKYRSKIGTSQRRVMPMAASVDFQNNVLTLVSFDLPSHPENHLYLNNAWDLPQKDPFTGDVFNSYNDGPPAPGKRRWGRFTNWKAYLRAGTRHGAIVDAPPAHVPYPGQLRRPGADSPGHDGHQPVRNPQRDVSRQIVALHVPQAPASRLPSLR